MEGEASAFFSVGDEDAGEVEGGADLRALSSPSAGRGALLVVVAVVAWFGLGLLGGWLWSCELSPPVAIRSPLSMATKVRKPTMMATPSRMFLFGFTRMKRAWEGSASPRKISGRRWKSVSPSKPPTAKATMMESEEGSMFGGHSARRKSGRC